jgi:hypothetical protein
MARIDEASAHLPRQEERPVYRVVEGQQLRVDVKLVIAVVALLGDVGMEFLFDLSNLEVRASQSLV